MPTMMVVGQTEEGDRQADARHDRQKDQDEHQGRVHLPKMQSDGAATVTAHSLKLAIAQTGTDCREAEPDEGSGCNNRSTQCSHR
jgi:hypothetical protein